MQFENTTYNYEGKCSKPHLLSCKVRGKHQEKIVIDVCSF